MDYSLSALTEAIAAAKAVDEHNGVACRQTGEKTSCCEVRLRSGLLSGPASQSGYKLSVEQDSQPVFRYFNVYSTNRFKFASPSTIMEGLKMVGILICISKVLLAVMSFITCLVVSILARNDSGRGQR